MPMKTLAVLSASAMLLSPMAQAATVQATVVSNGTILEGPGTHYTVIGNTSANTPVVVEGCLPTHDWCKINVNGAIGWIPASDVQVTTSSGAVVLSQPTQQVQVKTITFDKAKAEQRGLGGGVAGAAVGAAVGGPVGAVVGAAIGAAGGAATVQPTEKVTTYVTQNPLPPVQLGTTVAVGTVVPDTVTLTPVPDSQFSYIYVDGHPVLVNNQNRTVVEVMQ